MDHFALPKDELYIAWKEGRLHRNLMGYTTTSTKFLLGLGVSSISDTGNGFAQNEKTLHDYYAMISENKPAIKKGYFLSEEDEAFRKYILDIICKGEVSFEEKHLPLMEQYSFPLLDELEKDGLVVWDKYGLTVTTQGHNFLRNICSVFDLYLQRNSADGRKVFSKAI
jgi:oxygen-independent coproporphyrinogen-3 oxidase